MGDFREPPEERGYRNGTLNGEISLCAILLAGGEALDLYAREQLNTELADLEPLSYQRPDPTDWSSDA